jgi:hypothetical protein
LLFLDTRRGSLTRSIARAASASQASDKRFHGPGLWQKRATRRRSRDSMPEPRVSLRQLEHRALVRRTSAQQLLPGVGPHPAETRIPGAPGAYTDKVRAKQPGEADDASQRRMSGLPPCCRGLAHRVVQVRRTFALQRACGNRLSPVWPARWVSTGHDRAGASGCSPAETVRGKGGRVGLFGRELRGGTLAGYISAAGPGSQYANYWTPQQVQQADLDERAKRQGP